MTNNNEQSSNISTPQWAAVSIKLLQGPIYRSNANDKLWNTLTTYESNIQTYFAQIGLKVLIEKSDGYAYLTQDEKYSDEMLPKLIKKNPLSIGMSLLCVLLREALDNFDSSQSQAAFLVLKESEIKDMLTLYLPEQNDQTKLYAKFDAYITQLINLTFIKEVNCSETSNSTNQKHDREFEIRRIIRSKIDAEFLSEFKSKLKNFSGALENQEGDISNE